MAEKTPPLLTETLRLLNKTKQSPLEIARATGLNRQWINLLKQGDIPNPGIRKLWTLNQYLVR